MLGLTLGVGCTPPGEPGARTPEPRASATSAESANAGAAESEAAPVEWALAIHGGAGVRRSSIEASAEPGYHEALAKALEAGQKILAEGGSALDAVEASVRLLEDDPLFNAGRGSVFTSAGTNEMDAAIMDGRDRSCGAVSGLTTVRYPITLARRVMDTSKHVFLVGQGAETFADEVGVERVEPDFFFVQRRYDSWQRAVERERVEGGDSAALGPEFKIGTVGAVARDRDGNLAAATSTGGMTNKRFGRVGDVPVIGAGTYADNATCAVSGTGWGEKFIRHTVAHDIAARVAYRGLSVQQASEEVVDGVLDENDGGVIVAGADGSLAVVFNTEGMFYGAADATGRFETGIWDEPGAAGAAEAAAAAAAGG
ncbi:MAG: isoaspartyl peptidase/L-asparaginase [Acidobacteriota bacterium]